MVDTLIVTAYISLLLATAVDWASEGRIQSAGVVLPLSEQDCRSEKHVSQFITGAFLDLPRRDSPVM